MVSARMVPVGAMICGMERIARSRCAHTCAQAMALALLTGIVVVRGSGKVMIVPSQPISRTRSASLLLTISGHFRSVVATAVAAPHMRMEPLYHNVHVTSHGLAGCATFHGARTMRLAYTTAHSMASAKMRLRKAEGCNVIVSKAIVEISVRARLVGSVTMAASIMRPAFATALLAGRASFAPTRLHNPEANLSRSAPHPGLISRVYPNVLPAMPAMALNLEATVAVVAMVQWAMVATTAVVLVRLRRSYHLTAPDTGTAFQAFAS